MGTNLHNNAPDGPHADDAYTGIPSGRVLGAMRRRRLFATHAVVTNNIMGVIAFAPTI